MTSTDEPTPEGHHRFRVWAPVATTVELELFTTDDASGEPGERRPMEASDEGWWEVVAPAGPRTGYLFVVDGGEGRPDPRSSWQPDGVHGPSRLVDHRAFEWHDDGWEARPLADAVVYEAHVGTFSPEGTFAGAVAHLDALVDLGVTHLELMPIATFAGRWGWGYDGVDLYAPHPTYGTPEDLMGLVDEAHRRGLAVLLDCVYNHLGPVGNHLATFGPYFTDTYSTPWGEALNVDGAGSLEVRRFVVDNALMWLRDYHFDGLRLDAVHAIVDTSAVHLLEQMSAEVAELSEQSGRRLVLIAESDRNDPRLLQPRADGGLGIDAHWNDDFHHAVHVALTDERDSYYADYGGLAPLAESLRHAWVYRGQYSEFRERPHGRAPDGVPGDSFIGYVQNHDQIGNRARGERASQLLDPARLAVAAALVVTSPFVPMLFQGEEWAATAPFPYFADHHDDPELAEAVRQGRMEEFATFGWDPDEVADPEAEATFRSAILDRSEIELDPHASTMRWYRELLALRAAEPDLRSGDLEGIEVVHDDETGTIAYRRGEVGVAANLGDAPARVAIPGPVEGGELLLASSTDVTLTPDGVILPPDTVAIVRSAMAESIVGDLDPASPVVAPI